ncbi:membrane protein [Clostridia bacterium]|nr:membrane protein [Clostridia bacterium]
MTMLIIMLICDLMLVVPLAITPYFTRKTELFGVSIPASQSQNPVCKKLRAIYCAISLCLGAVLIAATWLIIDEDDISSVYNSLWLIGGYLAATFVVYLVMRSKMLALKAEQKWLSPYAGVPSVVMATSEPVGRDFISSVWLVVYPIILALTVIGLAIVWPNVPDPYPTHFNAAGVADAWTAKTVGSLAFLLFTQVGLDLVMIGCFFAMKYTKRQIDAENPEKSAAQLRVYRYTMGASLTFIGAATALLLGAMQILTILPDMNHTVFFIVSMSLYALAIIAPCVAMYRVGQGGSRVKVANAGDAAPQVNINDDKYWLLGVIYFNPKDPAYFVEQRFGLGMTFNLGKPAMIALAIFILAGTAAACILPFVL